MNNYKIVFQTETYVNESDDGAGIHTVMPYVGRVIHRDEENDSETVVGELDAFVIMPDWEHDHLTEADNLDAEAGAAVTALFENDGDVREDLQESGLTGMESGVLFLDTLKIDDAHRGLGIGLKVLWHAIRVLGSGCGTAICKPHPLYDDRQPKSDTEVATGKKKLRSYWAKLGFKKLPKTDFYVMNLNLKQPSFERATSVKKKTK